MIEASSMKGLVLDCDGDDEVTGTTVSFSLHPLFLSLPLSSDDDGPSNTRVCQRCF